MYNIRKQQWQQCWIPWIFQIKCHGYQEVVWNQSNHSVLEAQSGGTIALDATTRSCIPISLVWWNLENFQNILGMIAVGLTCCKLEELTLSSFCMWLGKQNLRVWPLFLDDQLLLLSMVTQTSTETRHAMVVPFNLGVRSHVIVSGYILSVKITLPSSLKGNEAAAAAAANGYMMIQYEIHYLILIWGKN